MRVFVFHLAVEGEIVVFWGLYGRVDAQNFDVEYLRKVADDASHVAKEVKQAEPANDEIGRVDVLYVDFVVGLRVTNLKLPLIRNFSKREMTIIMVETKIGKKWNWSKLESKMWAIMMGMIVREYKIV